MGTVAHMLVVPVTQVKPAQQAVVPVVAAVQPVTPFPLHAYAARRRKGMAMGKIDCLVSRQQLYHSACVQRIGLELD